MTEVTETRIRLKVSDGTEMQAFTAAPKGKPLAGLMVFPEAFGVNGHIRRVAVRFAREGYLAVAPELFHRSAPPGFEADYGNFPALKPHFDALTDEALLADVKASFTWLKGQPGIPEGKIACVGFCLGGRVSFEANAHVPLKAAVSFYGSRILTASLPKAKDQQAPLLLMWGGRDKSTPPDRLKELGDALRESGKDFVNVEFSRAEHGFFCDERASYNAEAAEEAWALTLAFLKKHLG